MTDDEMTQMNVKYHTRWDPEKDVIEFGGAVLQEMDDAGRKPIAPEYSFFFKDDKGEEKYLSLKQAKDVLIMIGHFIENADRIKSNATKSAFNEISAVITQDS
jgi:hypothetical protein